MDARAAVWSAAIIGPRLRRRRACIAKFVVEIRHGVGADLKLEEIQRGQTIYGIAFHRLVSVVAAGCLVDQWREQLERTGRYELVEALGVVMRHLQLLMAEAPHNGTEENHQLLLSPLDSDHYYAAGAHG